MAYVDDSGGRFIGDIGFGGVTPGFTIHCEKSVADAKLAFFYNTSSSGYGVRFQNGTDLNYAIKVTNAAGTWDTFQILGSGKTIIGKQLTSTSTENPVSVQDWITNFGSQALLHVSGQDATISMFANVEGGNTQVPSGKVRWGYMGLSSDNGVRMGQNLAYFPSGTSPKLYDPTMPRGNFGFDHDGTLSYSWDPAAVAGSGYDYRAGLGDRSNSPYVPQTGQSIVIYGQGRNQTPGDTEYGNVDICTMRAGQTLRFGTSNALNTPYYAMQITAHISGGPGNVNIFRMAVLGGTSGIPNMRLLSVGSVSGAADGSIWYDGTNFRGRLGGVDKTFTLT